MKALSIAEQRAQVIADLPPEYQEFATWLTETLWAELSLRAQGLGLPEELAKVVASLSVQEIAAKLERAATVHNAARKSSSSGKQRT